MDTNQEIILWGSGTARTLRPIWMAEELGLSYVLKPIGPRTGETQTKEFNMSPNFSSGSCFGKKA